MNVNFSELDFKEKPILILKNANGNPIGVLQHANNTSGQFKYNEVSTIRFEYPAYADGEATPFFDDLVGMRIIDLHNIGQFTLVKPVQEGSGQNVKKVCEGYSLEYEFAYKKITIENGTYRFHSPLTGDETVMSMIMELMPSWRIGDIPSSLWSKYRTFEVNNTNLYDFIKNTVQQTYNCIFEFDTYTRTVNVRDIAGDAVEKPIFLSCDNLVKELKIEENTDHIVTRLDVSGAEGVNIRSVNPCGTNKIINLGYYMTPENFSPELIAKYESWKELCSNRQQVYYNLVVKYSMKSTQQTAEHARLTDMEDELTNLENVRGVTIQGIALSPNDAAQASSLTEVNQQISAQQTGISTQKTRVGSVSDELAAIYDQMVAIRNECSYELFFTESERKQMDKYIKDDDLTDSSFVAETVGTYVDRGTSAEITEATLNIIDGQVEGVLLDTGALYTVRGGTIEVSVQDDTMLTASIISAAIDYNADGTFIVSLYLSSGNISGNEFMSACVTFSGTCEEPVSDDTQVSLAGADAYMYLTFNADQFMKDSVAWELYEYGEEVLSKLAQSSFTFTMDSANFIGLEEFTEFKNQLELGQKVYAEVSEGKVLKPICVEVNVDFDDPSGLKMQFSDSYVSTDAGFKLADLLDKSVSMGRSLELSKYVYSSFVDSGASTDVRDFMMSAFDVSKNAILSSNDQAISWDGAGLRLRKWANTAHTAYDDHQIWLNNNCIMMTDDGWNTAKMAIGHFTDLGGAGDCWGVVAETIVGTMLAGENLIIESTKKSGGQSVFRVDENGCKLYNSDIEITSGNRHIVIDPEFGLVMGKYPVIEITSDDEKSLNQANSYFYADSNGNLHIKGAINATELRIGDTDIEDYINGDGSKTYVQSTQPASPAAGDTWLDTTTGYMRAYDGSEWVIATTPKIVGAKINTDAANGTINISASSTLNLSGGDLNISGNNNINISSVGGLNLSGTDVSITGNELDISGTTVKLLTQNGTNGVIMLGSEGNTISSGGIMSLANGNIVLNGPSNIVSIGAAIGSGTIKLAGYNVASDSSITSSASSSTTVTPISAGSVSMSLNWVDQASTGDSSPSSISQTVTYTQASTATATGVTVTGSMISFAYNNQGVRILSSGSASALAPVGTGHLLGWETVSASTMVAGNISASGSIYAPNIYQGTYLVATQKWCVDTINSVLGSVFGSTSSATSSVTKTVNNISYRLNNHTHSVQVSDDGTVTMGSIAALNGTGTSFNLADTDFWNSRVPATFEYIPGTASISGGILTISASGINAKDEEIGEYEIDGINISSFISEITSSIRLHKEWSGGQCIVSVATTGQSGANTAVIQISTGLEPTYNSSDHTYDVTVSVYDGSYTYQSAIKTETKTIDASAAYTAGYNSGYSIGERDVTLGNTSWSGGIGVVEASNSKTKTIVLSMGTTTCTYNSSSHTYSISSSILDGGGSTGYTYSYTTDTAAYSDGYTNGYNIASGQYSVHTVPVYQGTVTSGVTWYTRTGSGTYVQTFSGSVILSPTLAANTWYTRSA